MAATRFCAQARGIPAWGPGLNVSGRRLGFWWLVGRGGASVTLGDALEWIAAPSSGAAWFVSLVRLTYGKRRRCSAPEPLGLKTAGIFAADERICMKSFRRLLVANRSEIAIRVFRSAHELDIRTVAIYSHEDRYALHRFKADEAYLIGKVGEPIRSYLDIDSIVALAVEREIDAIHPGYGFLSENPALRRACDKAGITFVGPRAELLDQLGDKTAARKIADEAKVPILGGSAQGGAELGRSSRGGGEDRLSGDAEGGARRRRARDARGAQAGRFGARTWRRRSAKRRRRLAMAKCSSKSTFAGPGILKCNCWAICTAIWCICSSAIAACSGGIKKWSNWRRRRIWIRRFGRNLCDAALAIGNAVRYENAGTVEFLVDADSGEFYFIEVNPRIQVEHTVTEEVTGIDIVKSQILIAQGSKLSDPEIGLASQNDVRTTGFALQCRVTTEDAENRFVPDYGRIMAYRSAAGMGIRLDAGTAFSGAVVTPYYDSLLVKVTARGRRFRDAVSRMERCLQEFRVRGVKTNIPFLVNLVTHPTFLEGLCTTTFIDETPELFHMPVRRDRASKLLQFLGETIVNGNPLVKDRPKSTRREPAPVPAFDHGQTPPAGTRQKFQELGPEKFSKWILDQKPLLVTDTTFRDAHQSLLATRMRTHDLANVAGAYAQLVPNLFSLEMWGGATFDTSMRFLKECPWQRLADSARGDSQHFISDVAAGIQRGRLHELSRQCGRGVREGERAGGDGYFPHFRSAQLDREHAGGDGCGASARRHLRSGDLLHGRHSESEAAEVQFEVLCRSGQRIGEDGGAHSGHQRHGRIVQTVCGRVARENAEAGNRHSDSFSYARYQRRFGGGGTERDRGGARYCRWGAGADVGTDLAAEFEFDRRGAAQHAA